MTMVSKNKLRKDTEERIKDLLYGLFADVKDKKSMNELLHEFFTPTERVMFAKRLAVGILLTKEWDSRSISRALKMSLSTIGSVNYWIIHHEGMLKKQIEKIIAKEKSESGAADVMAFLEGLVGFRYGQNWSLNRKLIEEEKRKHKHTI